ncbi:hypothetical protein HNV12_22425 [Methanococcoides sp. SA1]|nr:hypothetical protein [Methanococcoides sp. SA1]
MFLITIILASISSTMLANSGHHIFKWIVITIAIINILFRFISGPQEPGDSIESASIWAHGAVISFLLVILFSFIGIIVSFF